jgi:hypothetical protein
MEPNSCSHSRSNQLLYHGAIPRHEPQYIIHAKHNSSYLVCCYVNWKIQLDHTEVEMHEFGSIRRSTLILTLILAPSWKATDLQSEKGNYGI